MSTAISNISCPKSGNEVERALWYRSLARNSPISWTHLKEEIVTFPYYFKTVIFYDVVTDAHRTGFTVDVFCMDSFRTAQCSKYLASRTITFHSTNGNIVPYEMNLKKTIPFMRPLNALVMAAMPETSAKVERFRTMCANQIVKEDTHAWPQALPWPQTENRESKEEKEYRVLTMTDTMENKELDRSAGSYSKWTENGMPLTLVGYTLP